MTQDQAMQRAVDTLKPEASVDEACRHGFMCALAWVTVLAYEAAKDGELLAVGSPEVTE